MRRTDVLIANPNLEVDAFEFRSVTEYKDLPRKFDCLPEYEGDGISSTSAAYYCQNGCGEAEFSYVYEDGDIIRLQFHASDLVNTDPNAPEYGWRVAGGDPFFLQVEVLSLDGTVLWTGDTEEVALAFSVGASDSGPYQNIAIDVDKVLELTEGVECFYFRIKVILLEVEINSVNGDNEPTAPVDGYAYIDFSDNLIYEWVDGAWKAVEPGDTGAVWYVAETHTYYQWTGSGWLALPERPSPDEGNFDYLTTMTYRKRRCDERIVHFTSEQGGTDCSRFFHDVGLHVAGSFATTVDHIGAWTMIDEDVPTFTTIDTTVINQFTGTVWLYTSGGWVEQGTPGDLTLWVVTNGGTWDTGPFDGYVAPGTVLQYNAAPEIHWTAVSAANNALLADNTFQHDFKVRGSLELEEYPLERELTKNGRLINTTSITRARLRTYGLPADVARRIQAVFAGNSFTLNGGPWDTAEGPRRNNDEGTHWWLDLVVEREDCNIDTRC